MATGTSAAPWKPTRNAISCLIGASLALSAAGIARADIIPTEQAVNSTPQTYGDPAHTFLKRSDVENQLRSLGVGRKSAKERAAALQVEEVQAVAGKLDSLYAGGQYVPPPLMGAGAAGGAYGSGGYYGGGVVVTILAIGLTAALNWGWVPSNASNADYMTSNPTPMDPDRKISEQDCTKPIVYDGGNLRCK